MPKIITLIEKESLLLAALNDPSVSCITSLSRKLKVSRATTHNWLMDSTGAQVKLSQNKKAARAKKIKESVAQVDAIIQRGIAEYRAAAMVGLSQSAYKAYKRELTGQSC